MSKRMKVEIDKTAFQEQEIYMYQVKKINDEHFARTGDRKKHLTVTYGCQMNEHDSEKIAGMLQKMGYEETQDKNETNLIIYNTCCVRENAELKVYGNIGALKKLKSERDDLILAICGCMMQQPQIVEEIKKKYRHVDLVFGTHNIHKFPELLINTMQSDTTLVDVWKEEEGIIENVPVIRKYGIKALVNIMYGCDNFCTYCIVPYVRGRERSRELQDIVDEVTTLAGNGTKEITLLGQNVNSYGKTLVGKITFADLLRKLDIVKGIERIRFMTSHPKDLSDELIDAISECKKVCEHLHLPFQAGSDKVLNEMNRKYTKESYLALVDKVKTKLPNIALTTDIIVGFPGESEEDFNNTLEVVNKARFDSAFTFLYSIRTGTPAATMNNQIDDGVKHERFNRLLESVNSISEEMNRKYQDKNVEVLVEGNSKNNPNKLMGRTRQHKLVNFEGDTSLIGQLVNVKITEVKRFSLNGVIVN
ncbi:MAG: tRNA (N6-isopentenyl adenosine(37)-C2)-methylthiotransferase MiaB [Alkaliphilus sp.]|nr:tRNA (N6-isopentenyl adenosine(37)-C2)-methylthiotransferase MiaB [Alkaliphilus sp. AH-315-G20]MBN4074767.1 tRNA (N6-isopentenyl adenosine(37)-C2)-methylthiotransferase MiaB [bacterium AH-315-E09]PHS30927.1 MAG: tRNA (N6-isopentenyl adenosine(37)-C2)-methylthiotransferase MiaB [Alkaliphilus sp.]